MSSFQIASGDFDHQIILHREFSDHENSLSGSIYNRLQVGIRIIVFFIDPIARDFRLLHAARQIVFLESEAITSPDRYRKIGSSRRVPGAAVRASDRGSGIGERETQRAGPTSGHRRARPAPRSLRSRETTEGLCGRAPLDRGSLG
jgi:hypothetical protein